MTRLSYTSKSDYHTQPLVNAYPVHYDSPLIYYRAISREQCGSFPPEDFKPERFLKDAVPIADPFDYIFGFGKRSVYHHCQHARLFSHVNNLRSCPGKKLGLNNVMLICSSLLKAFDIVPVPDENGKLTPPNPKYINGLARYVFLL